MIERMKRWAVGGLLAGMIASLCLGMMAPSSAMADQRADDKACNSAKLLTFPAWYNGINKASRDSTNNNELVCTPSTSKTGGSISKFIWKIALNIVNIMLQLVGYLCIGYIIYGGWKYLTSAGEADRIASGRKLILYAVVGLVISFFAVAFVSIIGANIK